MAQAEIHLTGGSVVRFECTELTTGRSPTTGSLVKLSWEGAVDGPMFLKPEEVVSVRFVRTAE